MVSLADHIRAPHIDAKDGGKKRGVDLGLMSCCGDSCTWCRCISSSLEQIGFLLHLAVEGAGDDAGLSLFVVPIENHVQTSCCSNGSELLCCCPCVLVLCFGFVHPEMCLFLKLMFCFGAGHRMLLRPEMLWGSYYWRQRHDAKAEKGMNLLGYGNLMAVTDQAAALLLTGRYKCSRPVLKAGC
ncbi:hypothetical protein Nepgr_008090 [Nepenthes gracilis]|uniref:Uncharacterized protein n=1 Tax=Nepenthes gracilis TaxID=150966 RepID=A0AAD3S8A1_NEPGR|nr:hypothetical protein Nepgr_008090 [Nepenthes gracilis]